MAATTAQLLLGNPHPNDGGLTTIDRITLTEGGRPAWTLSGSGHIWIPSIENMLDDALLMAAIHCFKSEVIRSKFENFGHSLNDKRLQIYDLNPEERQELYKLCQNLDNYPKIVVTVYKDSSLIRSIHTLKNYEMECEVLMPVYTRLYSRWTGKTTIEGTLPPER